MSNILELNIALYSHRHEADQDYNHLGQLEEVELLLLDTALPLLLSPEVIKLNKVNNTIEKKTLYYGSVLICTCLMFCRSMTASPKQ